MQLAYYIIGIRDSIVSLTKHFSVASSTPLEKESRCFFAQLELSQVGSSKSYRNVMHVLSHYLVAIYTGEDEFSQLLKNVMLL